MKHCSFHSWKFWIHLCEAFCGQQDLSFLRKTYCKYHRQSYLSCLHELSESNRWLRHDGITILSLCPSCLYFSLPHLPFQEINKRMVKQGYNETHLYRPDYPGFTHKVLRSPYPVVRLQELNIAKQFNAIMFSTASG